MPSHTLPIPQILALPSRRLVSEPTLRSPHHATTNDCHLPHISEPLLLRHVALQAVDHSPPRRPEMTHTASAGTAALTRQAQRLSKPRLSAATQGAGLFSCSLHLLEGREGQYYGSLPGSIHAHLVLILGASGSALFFVRYVALPCYVHGSALQGNKTQKILVLRVY